jgi:hypothetical protein
MQIDKKELLAQIKKWEAESADWEAESKAWKAGAEQRARQSRAYELTRHLEKIRSVHLCLEASTPLQEAIVAAIAALPADPPDPVAVRRRQEARAVADKIGVPLDGTAEAKLLHALETAIEAADAAQQKADEPMRAAYARITNKTERME